MNAVKMLLRVLELTDLTRTARHSDESICDAINQASMMILKDRTAPIRAPRQYSVQSAQRIRDELYTLIPAPATGALSSGNVPYPASYYLYLLVYITINSKQQYCRPTTYNEIGPLSVNPFRKPSPTKPYFNEYTSGLKLHYGGTGTVGNYELWYVKNPATVTIGTESNKLTGPVTISNTTLYYVYEDAVHNGTTYYAGTTFTSATTTLTSGIIIPATVITSSDFPVNMHDEICSLAASLLSGKVEDWYKKQALNSDVEKS